MDNKDVLNRIEDKIDSLHEKLHDQAIILTKQELNLALHMKRSDAIEEQVVILKDIVMPEVETVKKMKFLGSFIFSALTLATALLGVYLKYR